MRVGFLQLLHSRLAMGPIRLFVGALSLVAGSALVSSCLATHGHPRLEGEVKSTINAPESYRLNNLKVVHVEPGGQEVQVHRRGYNIRSGDSFRVPFEEIEIVAGTETYLVSTEKAGGVLFVNGAPVAFDPLEQHLRIAIGTGYSIEPGGASSFEVGDAYPEAGSAQ